MKWLLILMVGAVSAGAAGVKISDLPARSVVASNDLVVVVAGGETYRATAGQVVVQVAAALPELMVTNGSLVVSNLATADANQDQAVVAYSEIGTGVRALSRDGQGGKFAQTGWTAPHSDVPVLRVWSGTGTGQPTSPLVKLNDSDPLTQRPLLVAVGSGGQTNFYVGPQGDVAGASMTLRGSGAPANPTEGTIYFDTVEKAFFGWNGTIWQQL